MDWSSKTPVAVPDHWLRAEYYEAFTLTFRIENALRLFAYLILKSALQEKWMQAAIESDDGSQTSVSALARQRQTQDKKFGYLGTVSTSPFVYLTSGELFRLMLSNAYWPHFSKYFPASRGIISTKLEEFSNIRNSLAHFRPVLEEHVATLKHIASQLLPLIESTLASVVTCTHVVPPNYADNWYAKLSDVDATPFEVKCRHSADWAWVAIRLHYPCRAVFDYGATGSSRKTRLAKLDAAKVLELHPQLRANVVAMLEEVRDDSTGQCDPCAKKVLALILNATTLQSNWQVVRADLVALLETLRAETSQVEKNHLVHCSMIHAVDVFSERRTTDVGSFWSHDLTSLESARTADDPVEYWGRFSTPSPNHFISATRRYPWMLVDV